MKARFLLLLCGLVIGPLALTAQDFRLLDGAFNDLAYNAADDRLYVVTGGDYAEGNAILALDPATGAVLQRMEVGSEPALIRVSDNGRYLYVVLYGAPYLQRYDLTNGVFDPVTPLEDVFEVNGDTYHYPTFAGDLAPLPGNGQSFVLSRSAANTTPSFQGLVVYDNSTKRPDQIGPSVTAGDKVVVSADGQTLWGLGHGYDPTAFKRYQITAQGLSEVSNHPGLIVTEVTHVAQQNGRIYLQNGQLFDVTGSAPALLHTFDIGQSYGYSRAPQVPALDANVVYQVGDFDPADPSGSNYQGTQLRVFDKTTFVQQAAHLMPGWNYGITPKKLISLGQGRVAVLGTALGRAKLALFNEAPCQSQNLGLTVTPAAPVFACFGDTVTLQAAPGYTDYYWSNGVTGPTLRVTANTYVADSFSYRVLAPNGCLSQPSAPTTVRFDQGPTDVSYVLQDYRSVLCPGQTAGIYPLSSNGAWQFVCSNGDTIVPGQQFNVSTAGVYTIRALSQFGCPSPATSVEIFEAHPGETAPEVTASGPLSFCGNQPTVLSAPPGAFGYEWTNGATTRSLTPPYTTQYAVRLKYADGCVGPWSDTLDVEVKFVPSVLTFNESFSTLLINGLNNVGDSVQWSLNGQVLPGETSGFLSPQQDGFYTVQNFLGGCVSAPSAPFVFPQTVAASVTAFPGNSPPTIFTLSVTPIPAGDYTYAWDGGSTDQFIQVDQAGTYCVTVTRTNDGATAIGCRTLTPNDRVAVTPSYGPTAVPGMPVVILSLDGAVVTPLDTLVSGANGQVLFENLPQGEYLLEAAPVPGSQLANQYLPTFFYSALLWTDASPIQIAGFRVDNDPPIALNIYLVPLQMLTGGGTVSGFLTEGPGFTGGPASDGSGTSASGDPLAGVSVLLYDSNGNVVGHSVSDANGFYSFGNLPPGSYTVTVNLPGVPPFSQLVTVGQGATVGGVSFTLLNGAFVSGTSDLEALQARVWPNPTTGQVRLDVPVAVTLTLTNSLGQRLLQQKYPAGQHVLNALEGQPAGVYFVQVQAENGRSGVERLVKQ